MRLPDKITGAYLMARPFENRRDENRFSIRSAGLPYRKRERPQRLKEIPPVLNCLLHMSGEAPRQASTVE